MMEYGYVEWNVTRRTQIGDSSIPIIAWEWHGPAVAKVDRRLLWRVAETDTLVLGQRLNLGPYPVKIIDSEPSLVIIARTDTYLWAHTVRYWLSIWGNELTARTVLTLAIWGLAQWPGDAIPRWQHVTKYWRKKWEAFRGVNA